MHPTMSLNRINLKKLNYCVDKPRRVCYRCVPMIIEFDETPMAVEHKRAIKGIATTLRNSADERTTRRDVAEVIQQNGFGAYVGEHHVAIHHKDSTGAIRGGRLAVVTHYGTDWITA